MDYLKLLPITPNSVKRSCCYFSNFTQNSGTRFNEKVKRDFRFQLDTILCKGNISLRIHADDIPFPPTIHSHLHPIRPFLIVDYISFTCLYFLVLFLLPFLTLQFFPLSSSRNEPTLFHFNFANRGFVVFRIDSFLPPVPIRLIHYRNSWRKKCHASKK